MELLKDYIAHEPRIEGSEHGSINFIDICNDNFYFATASDNQTVKIWALEGFYNYTTGDIITTLPEQESIVNFVKFFDAGRLILTVNWAGYVRLYQRTEDWLDFKEIDSIRPILTDWKSRWHERNVYYINKDNILIFDQMNGNKQLIIKVQNNKIELIEELEERIKQRAVLFQQKVNNETLTKIDFRSNEVTQNRYISSKLSSNNKYLIIGDHDQGNIKIYYNPQIKETRPIFYIYMDNEHNSKLLFEGKNIRNNSFKMDYLDWNDNGIYTTFILNYISNEGKIHKIGRIKVMHKNMNENNNSILNYIPRIFYSLDSNFCSVGEDEDYYIEVKHQNIINDLAKLNDIVSLRNSSIEEFSGSLVFKNSLLRYTTEDTIRNIFSKIISGRVKALNYEFSFEIENMNARLDVKVNPDSTIPTNIHTIIGRNGSGKTRLLSGIADSLTNTQNEYSLKGEIKFSNTDYRFVKLIVVAFSVFDNFKPISNQSIKENINYKYIGLKQEKLLDSDLTDKQEKTCYRDIKELEDDFIDSIIECFSKSEKHQWNEIISILEKADGNFKALGLSKINELNDKQEKHIRAYYAKLSSGHKIILYTITKLIEETRDKTLILIDEPENHLHPPLLSAFIRGLSYLLKGRNAVAIVATHSPVVLQEVPKACVSIMQRLDDNYFFIKRPEFETFGENVGLLTSETFGLDVTESGFYTLLKSISQNNSYEDGIDQLSQQLGNEGRLFLRMFTANTKEEN